ncbi:breast cancer anti-estrogen resistance protein 3 isoform X2 [Engystomops pustulosus]|uniref:breast cancer anti-estrogen resistance protein 3 isoform X2 n=1 Tax=Engystomops pustulosus TaxID=76066 RepID=UPI003AFAB707
MSKDCFCNVYESVTAALCCFYQRKSVIGVKFSKERYIMDGGTPDKLKKELEEELKLSSEDLRSHAWYHGRIPRQVSESLVRRDGDFLIRDSLSSPGNFVLTCQWKNLSQHFKINKVVIRLNEAYSRLQYQFEHESFDNIPALVRYYVGNRKSVSQQSGAIIFQPINRTVPLRCIEEKYGVSPVRRLEMGALEEKTETPKRLSLNIGHGQGHGLTPEQSLIRGNLLRNKEKSGSHPSCLDNMREKRRPLNSHQSESYLPLGSRQPYLSPAMDGRLTPRPHVFRTGSEPTLSPTEIRRFSTEAHSAEALRGSDSQLCPRPPPKPSKSLYVKQPQSPTIWPSSEANYCELHPTPPEDFGWTKTHSSHSSFVESPKGDDAETFSLSNSELSFPALEDNVSLSSHHSVQGDDVEFVRPVYENVSSFNPIDFNSIILPPENKPLETTLLKRAKELFTNNDPRTIAKHILRMDCKVARILDVSPEMEKMMGVGSGLELITLPHGHQLRLDLIERHMTMAIGIAVDILGCTGNLEERVATLNKIIQLAVEVKNLGDFFAFTSIMKALDMPQITRLENTWTILRHQYTQTAITYEKQLKPFNKALFEGAGPILDTQENVTVPLVMPIILLLERQSVIFEGMDWWENHDRGCEIMFSHLESARFIAQNTALYQSNAERFLEGFKPDEEMSEIFKTEFQMRLLWGSKGAQVNQAERYQKFSQILTALSRKLEPPSS